MESDSIQLIRFHKKSLWIKLYINTASDNPCKLQNSQNLFLRQIVQLIVIAPRIQTVLAYPKTTMSSKQTKDIVFTHYFNITMLDNARQPIAKIQI